MQALILAGMVGLMAAAVWLTARGCPEKPPPAPENQNKNETETQTETEHEPDFAIRPADALAGVLGALRAVMEHPELGGPGFLTVQFPLSRCGSPEVSAQYPNIRETLYRRIVRGELEPEELIRAGIPETLFARRAEFTAESGGMVMLTVEMKTEDLSPELEKRIANRESRGKALDALAEALGGRFPDMTVRVIGWDLLLTPGRADE